MPNYPRLRERMRERASVCKWSLTRFDLDNSLSFTVISSVCSAAGKIHYPWTLRVIQQRHLCLFLRVSRAALTSSLADPLRFKIYIFRVTDCSSLIWYSTDSLCSAQQFSLHCCISQFLSFFILLFTLSNKHGAMVRRYSHLPFNFSSSH